MSQERDDDSPRRCPEEDAAAGADAGNPDDAGRAESEGAPGDGEEGPRPALPAPVDPYADPLSGAGPYEPSAEDAPDEHEEGPVVGEVQRREYATHVEMDRLRQYRREQDEEAPPKPPPQAVGNYPYEAHLPTHPTDTVRQFSSMGGGKPRHRRSDWPVLTFAMVVAAVVTAGCCLAGFALFSAWHPFGQ